MFIFTTKFNRKRAVVIILAFAVLLSAVILIAGHVSSPDGGQAPLPSNVAKNNGQRVKYLNSLGWEVEENAVEEQDVVIPKVFTGVYEDYNKIQLSQGFDLSQYGGVEATRYTYRILNYPGDTSGVVADIIVYRGEVIAGNIQSSLRDGFMSGLEFPKK